MNIDINRRSFIQKRLYFYHFLNDGITFILPTLMATFFILFGLTWFQVGLIFAFHSLTTVIFQLIIGYYTDKNISKKLMEIGIFLLAFSSFLMIFSFNFISLFTFALISGFALAFQHSISYATTSRMYDEEKDIMIGRQGASGDLGKCVAVFSSALIIIFFEFWQITLILWALLVIIFFFLILFNFRKLNFEDYYIEGTKEKNNQDNHLKSKMLSSVAIIILIIFVLYLAIYSLLITNLATFLKVEKDGLTSRFSGLILGYTLIFGVLGAYLSGRVKKSLGLSNSILIFCPILIIILSLYLYMNTSDFIINLIFFAFIGFFLFLLYPQLLATVNDIFHSKRLGFGFGIVLSLGWFGNFIGSLIGGYFADIYSGNVFFVLAIIWLILILIFASIIRLRYKIL